MVKEGRNLWATMKLKMNMYALRGIDIPAVDVRMGEDRRRGTRKVFVL